MIGTRITSGKSSSGDSTGAISARTAQRMSAR